MMGRIEYEGITYISTFVRILNRIIRSLSSCTPEHNNGDNNKEHIEKLNSGRRVPRNVVAVIVVVVYCWYLLLGLKINLTTFCQPWKRPPQFLPEK